MMNVIKIIEYGLVAHGFHGLVVPGECGCIVGDISPGDCMCERCEAGYKHTHSQKPGWWITSTNKNTPTDAEIEQVMGECF